MENMSKVEMLRAVNRVLDMLRGVDFDRVKSICLMITETVDQKDRLSLTSAFIGEGNAFKSGIIGAMTKSKKFRNANLDAVERYAKTELRDLMEELDMEEEEED